MEHAATFDAFKTAKIPKEALVKKDIKELEIKMESIKKDIIIKLASILGGITVFCFGAATTILGFLITRLH